jgi:signal transduction histidine kinase
MKKTNYGIGLSGIRERVKFYDCKTEIQSTPGKRYMLEVQIPLKEIY